MTRLLVLGILDMQPMSGYDIQQALKMTDAERWGGVMIGSIYHALKKLDQEGHVEIASIEQTGNRQKAIYQITQQGRDYLKELVQEILTESKVMYPTRLYSGISFYHKLGTEASITALEQQQIDLNQEWEAVTNGLEAKKMAMEQRIHPMTQLVFDHMLAVIKEQQNLVEKALALLKDQK